MNQIYSVQHGHQLFAIFSLRLREKIVGEHPWIEKLGEDDTGLAYFGPSM